MTREMRTPRLATAATLIMLCLVTLAASQLHRISQPDPLLHHQRHTRSLEHQVQRLDELLQSMDPQYLSVFIKTYHFTNNTQQWQQLVTSVEGSYFYLVGKMYLYGLLDDPQHPSLQSYRTQATYLAAFFYFKVAAENYSNKQAYYWLGLLEQFKLVPDKVIETNLADEKRSKQQEVVYKYLKTSHLNNGEHNLFISAALGFDPAALVLGHMNREPYGTTLNCTSALAYYLAVLKRSLFEPYAPKLVIDVSYSLEDELFSRKPLKEEEERNDHSFVMDTGYFDEETISATLEQANRYYTGSRGTLRDLGKALQLFQKLSEQGNSEGKIMAGLMYFRGQGVSRDIHKAHSLFTETPKDEVSEYMLLVMDYFEIIAPNTKERALKAMKNKSAGKEKLTHLMNFLIGSAALKGQLKEINHEQAVEMVDKSAADGNPSARLLMAILFSDGAKGLKYGCHEATKYLSEDAVYHPYFSKRTNTAEVALKRGMLSFAFFKYFELVFNSYQTAFINSLYLLEMYHQEALRLGPHSWQPSHLAQSLIYHQLRQLRAVPDIYSLLLQAYSPLGTQPFQLKDLDRLLTSNEKVEKAQLGYMLKKIVKRGVGFQKRGMLKYYEYKLTVKEGGGLKQLQPILSTLASGDSSKLFVLEARFLLGQLYHRHALQNKQTLTKQDTRKIMGEYNRAVKSELLGQLIFEVEQYRLTGQFDFEFAETVVGQDLLTFIFVLAIIVFVLYYLRSQRFDLFHRVELEKQLRRTQEERLERERQQPEPEGKVEEGRMKEEKEKVVDRDQPVISDDREGGKGGGIRIGSSSEEELS